MFMMNIVDEKNIAKKNRKLSRFCKMLATSKSIKYETQVHQGHSITPSGHEPTISIQCKCIGMGG
jgi:hypothetical protein